MVTTLTSADVLLFVVTVLLPLALSLVILYWIIRKAVAAGIRDSRADPKVPATYAPSEPTHLEPTADNPRPNAAAVQQMLREQRKQ